MTETIVTIDHLGGLGDGVAEGPTGRVHIPFTAPGDEARIMLTGKDAGRLVELLQSSPLRADPPCTHFGRCGGCALQHLQPDFIADWKRSRVVGALARSNLGQRAVSPTIVIPPGTRRRATLAAARIGKRLLLGFAERASHRLVDLKECHVLTEDLVRLIAPLRDRLGILVVAKETADFVLTATETGVDCVVVRRRPLGLADREALADFAETFDLARVSWRASPTAPAEPVAARRSPQIRIGDDLVAFAPGAFLQPSREGEAQLTRIVQDAISGIEGAVADLFCGLGTFALPSSRTNAVSAFDSDSTAIIALRNAARGRRLVAQARDLFREPLTVTELDPFSGAIIDPPRAGAQAQARTLADSGVTTVAYVSCNPTSFARDAAILVEGGYRLEQTIPIDQFAWSPHVELVGVFRR